MQHEFFSIEMVRVKIYDLEDHTIADLEDPKFEKNLLASAIHRTLKLCTRVIGFKPAQRSIESKGLAPIPIEDLAMTS